MDVEVKASQVDVGFTGDIEMYQDRVAVATGVPKGYLIQEGFGTWNTSAVSLIEQFKPFARSVYSLQSAFLDGLSELFRLHFAISGKFDFRTPFTLSLRYPAEEVSDEKIGRQNASLDMASSVLDMIRAAIGAEEDEGLPPDITRDIIAKYTFLDPADVVKWTRDAKYSNATSGESSSDEDSGGDEDFDLEKDMEDEEDLPAEDEGSASLSLDDMDFGEGKVSRKNRLLEAKKQRLRELANRYSEAKDSLYFRILKENAIGDFVRNKQHVHTSSYSNDSSSLMLKTLSENAKPNTANKRMLEVSMKDILTQIREDNTTN